MTTLAFLDTETTGLDPDRHEVWEVGLILRDEQGDHEHLWQLPVDLGKADAMALNIGRWYERRWPSPIFQHEDAMRVEAAVAGEKDFVVPYDALGEWCALFAKLTDGAHLVGAVISFDEERLRRLLRKNGACPTWHYHLIDVEALAAGSCARSRMAVAAPPWSSEELSRAVGVAPERFDRHTALGDARWARAIYDAVMSGGSYEPETP